MADPNQRKGRIPNSVACRLPYSPTDHISYSLSIRRQEFLDLIASTLPRARFCNPAEEGQNVPLKNIHKKQSHYRPGVAQRVPGI